MKKYIRLIAIALLTFCFTSTAVANSSYIDLPTSESTQSSYVYRFWSPVFRGHFYTTDRDEAMQVANVDTNWNFEKIGYSAHKIQVEDTVPVYRFWSPIFKGHFYTTSQDEWRRVKDTDANWTYEWIGYYAYPTSYEGPSRPVYRFWSPVFLHHFFTIDEEEMIRVRDTDPNWVYEGEAFKVPLDDTNTTEEGSVDELVEATDVAAIQVQEATDVTADYPDQVSEGNKLITTKIFLQNLSDETLSYDINDFILRDNETDITYPASLLHEPILELGSLEPDESVEGYLTFEVPEDANDLTLEFSSDEMDLKNNKISVTLDVTPTVVIISHGIVENQFSGKKIVGTVKNNTEDPVRYVKITANFFNADNDLIGSDFSYAEGADIEFLQSNDTAEFQIWYDGDENVESYRLDLGWQTS